jgi:glycosyltransferase involved in cell wall biosynthesis
LLFRGLADLPGIEVVGLLQSGNLVVEPGLPVRRGELLKGLPESQAVDRNSRVVVSLQQGAASHRFEHWRKLLLKMVGPAWAALRSVFGGRVALGGFDATHFQDFVWRALFAKSLPDSDRALVTSRPFRIMRWPLALQHTLGVFSVPFVGRAVYPRLDTAGIDVLLVETPYPGRVSGRTTMVVRYHDAVPLLMPHTIKNRGHHRAIHYHALLRNARDGAWFACVSEATRQDLLSVMPQLADRAVTIPNMISHHFFDEISDAARVPEIIWSRKNRQAPHEGGAPVADDDLEDAQLPYLLMVSTIEPRKNHLALLDAWELLRAGEFPRLNMVFVGSLGWDHENILRRFAPWLQRGGLHLLEDVPASDLRLLYRHARATVCPSFGEGFDFPGVEAMRSGGVVAASDIRVHRDVFGEAAEYFSPYSAAELAERLASLLHPQAMARRQSLVEAGARVSAQYVPERVMPQWQEFLRRVVS